MQLNFTPELALLMKFTGETATAIRMYSAYSGGSPSNYLRVPYDRDREAEELMFLSDALHHFSTLGSALQETDPARVVQACDMLLNNFAYYDSEFPGSCARQAKPTFDRWRAFVDINMAREAFSAIRSKAAAACPAV